MEKILFTLSGKADKNSLVNKYASLKGYACYEELKKEIDAFSDLDQTSIAQVLVVVSNKGYNEEQNKINETFFLTQKEGLQSMGVPYDVCCVCQAEKLNLDNYKLIIFFDAFDIVSAEFIQKLKDEDKTVLWIYGPDYLNNELAGMQNATEINIVKLIGDESEVYTQFGKIKFDNLPQPRFFIEDNDVMPLGIYPNTEKVAIGMKRFGSWTSIYSAVGSLCGNVLRNIARIAGVHIYSDDNDAPVYITDKVKAIYSNKDTVFSIKNGTYVEQISGNTYTVENGKITVQKGDNPLKIFVRK